MASKRFEPDGEDIFSVLEVPLPVELLTASELIVLILLAHGLAGEVKRTLADGGMAVGVHRSEIVAEEAGGEIGTAALLSSPHVDELVVLRSEIRMVRIDEVIAGLQHASS